MAYRSIIAFFALLGPLAAFLAGYLKLPPWPQSPVVVDAQRNITYKGTLDGDVEYFQGIFYAHDTSGNNRFAPPVPFLPDQGAIINATSPSAWCPQAMGGPPLPFTSAITNVSENCLSLNIARPRGISKNANLPVIVWLHGGGHALGSGSDQFYNPSGLVKQSKKDSQPVLFVSINYRLGMFGFATSEQLIRDRHCNAGLRDQRAAFDWIGSHIQWFGGDPNSITAIGQSVGSSDIGLHLTSYGGSKGVPFHRAMMMSGAPGTIFKIQSDLVKNNTAEVAEKLNCCSGIDDCQSATALACLRTAPMEQLRNVSVTMSQRARPPFGEGFFYPTHDYDYIQGRPSKLLRAGKFVHNVPLVLSWVANEGAWYAPPTTETDEDVLQSFGKWLFNLSPGTQQRLLELYPRADFEHMVRPDVDGSVSAQYYRAAQMNRDIWFTCPALDFAWQYVKGDTDASNNLWLYEFNSTRFAPVLASMGVPFWRVSHLSDIPFLFNEQVAAGGDNSEPQMSLSRLFSSSAVRFANTGSPLGSKHGVSEWPNAFPLKKSPDLQAEFPQSLSLYVFDGTYQSGPVDVAERRDWNEEDDEKTRNVLNEKLFKRCSYINSALVQSEIGV